MNKYIILLIFGCDFAVSELLGKYPGANCTWQERSGKCVHVYRCRSAMENIREKNPPPICSFQGSDPIVCCTDCSLVNDTRKVLYDSNVGVLIGRGRKSENQCFNFLKTLEYPCKKSFNYTHNISHFVRGNCNEHKDIYSNVNKEIVNSINRRFPHMAYLGYGESNKADWLCGGTVISERFVLTAAECLKPDLSTGTVKFVAMGIHKRWVSPSEWQRYNVKRAIPHPEYKAQSKYNDIALIETDRKIIFGPNVLPACLDSGYQERQEANTVTWSEGQNGTLDFAKISNFGELCSFFYPSQPILKNGYNGTTQLCFGDKERPKDRCEGELGFPLQSTFRHCFQIVLGVASMKRECGEAGGSGLFTRVSYYVPWIESIVWP